MISLPKKKTTFRVIPRKKVLNQLLKQTHTKKNRWNNCHTCEEKV